MLGIVNIVIPATDLAKTVAKTSYSLLEYLHGMQGISGSSPLGSISFIIDGKDLRHQILFSIKILINLKISMENSSIFLTLEKLGLTSKKSRFLFNNRTRDLNKVNVWKDKLSGVIYISHYIGDEFYKVTEYKVKF